MHCFLAKKHVTLPSMRADLGRRGSDKIALVRVGHTVEARLEDCSLRYSMPVAASCHQIYSKLTQ